MKIYLNNLGVKTLQDIDYLCITLRSNGYEALWQPEENIIIYHRLPRSNQNKGRKVTVTE